jgi:type IV secretion system protein VirB10
MNRTGRDDDRRLFAAEDVPRVAHKPSIAPLAAGLAVSTALGVFVFLQLSAARQDTIPPPSPPIAVSEQPVPLPPPPDMSMIAPPAIIAEPVLTAPPESPPPLPPAPTQAEIDRLRAPAIVFDQSEYANATGVSGGSPPLSAGGAPAVSAGAPREALSGDEQFALRLGVGDRERPSRAERMTDTATTVIEGAIIPAILETALSSDLPGYVRALVSRDVRGFDGKHILVPRGSRLIGQYRAGLALGQSRAFVIWTRIIRPDGVTIDLASPATDGLGRGGIEGTVDTHFFERFGGAILLSLLNFGAGAVTDASDTQIVIATTQAGAGAAGAAIASGVNISPTVRVPQGSPVRVFVAQDLDFSGVGGFVPDSETLR